MLFFHFVSLLSYVRKVEKVHVSELKANAETNRKEKTFGTILEISLTNVFQFNNILRFCFFLSQCHIFFKNMEKQMLAIFVSIFSVTTSQNSCQFNNVKRHTRKLKAELFHLLPLINMGFRMKLLKMRDHSCVDTYSIPISLTRTVFYMEECSNLDSSSPKQRTYYVNTQ